MASWNGKRTFFLGVNTGFVSHGEPNSRFVEFYRQRSSEKLHCAIVGNVVVPGGHKSNHSTPTIGANSVWSEIAHAIQECGTLPGIQLATAWEGYEGSRSFLSAGGELVIDQAKSLVQSLGQSGLDETLESFRSAATIAVDHGFKHIQIHAAHGYLLSLLVDPRINPEASRVEDHLKELAKWLQSVGVESSIRISMQTGDIAFDAIGDEEFQDRIATLPLDFIDLSSGFYNINKRLIYPALESVIDARFQKSVDIAERHPARNFIFSGRVMQNMDRLPRNGHIGLCRDLIANPQFLAEPEDGCRNYGKCHYFSRGKKNIECSKWNEV